MPSTKPGSKLTASQRVFIQTEVRTCLHLSCSLSSSKEYLRVFYFWFLQGFLSGSPGLLGGNWTLKVAQVSGNSEGMSSCLEVQNLGSSHARCGQDELPVLLGWCVEEAPWLAHQSPCPGALASSARCWLPGAPSWSCGRFIHIIVSNC